MFTPVEMFEGCWCIVDEQGRATFEIEKLEILAETWAWCIVLGSLEACQEHFGFPPGYEIYD